MECAPYPTVRLEFSSLAPWQILIFLTFILPFICVKLVDWCSQRPVFVMGWGIGAHAVLFFAFLNLLLLGATLLFFIGTALHV